MTEFTCSSCHNTYERNRTDAEALEEAEARHGPISEENLTLICDRCMAWMNDLERICRNIATARGFDPDRMIITNDEPVPLWTKFIPAARLMTDLPSPVELRTTLH